MKHPQFKPVRGKTTMVEINPTTIMIFRSRLSQKIIIIQIIKDYTVD